MFTKVLLLLYWYYIGNIYAYSSCLTVITDPLEKCNNLFSQVNLPKDRFDDLKDPSSRHHRRTRQCKTSLKGLYRSLSSTITRRSLTKKSVKPSHSFKSLWKKIQKMKMEQETLNLNMSTSFPNRTIMLDDISLGIKVIPSCNKLYFASVVDMMPFSYQMIEAIGAMFKRCCGDYAVLCSSSTLSQMGHVNHKTIDNSDIVFPILGQSSMKKIHGYHFTPIYKAPGVYFFSKRQSKASISYNIANTCKNLWPLLTICLLFALISGFVVWCIETRVNEEEFPREFHVGIFEGFWWSFISMSTVGYGDKAPKSIAGRIFSIIWILVGITICSMFTASLTTEITKWISSQTPVMSGKRIAALQSRLLDALIVAKQGGIIKEVPHDNVSEGIEHMTRMLNNDSISGFVVDTVTYNYFVSWGKQHIKGVKLKDTTRNTVDSLLRTRVTYDGDKLSFGALFKDEKNSRYFNDYFSENRLYLEACYSFQMNAKMIYSKEKNFLLDPAGGLFYTILYYVTGVLVLILLFGTVYELRRNRGKKRRGSKQPESESLGMECNERIWRKHVKY